MINVPGASASVTKVLQKLAEKLKVVFQQLKVCYETGPTSLVIARHLIKRSLECVLMSPSKTECKSGDKIKTDMTARQAFCHRPSVIITFVFIYVSRRNMNLDG